MKTEYKTWAINFVKDNKKENIINMMYMLQDMVNLAGKPEHKEKLEALKDICCCNTKEAYIKWSDAHDRCQSSVLKVVDMITEANKIKNFPKHNLYGLLSIKELMMIDQLPIGALVPLDSSLASIVATGICLLLAPLFPSRKALIALALLISLPVAVFAQKASILVRKFNGNLSHWAEKEGYCVSLDHQRDGRGKAIRKTDSQGRIEANGLHEYR